MRTEGQAEDARLVTLETARETAKRKAPSGNDSFRAKKTAIVEFLRDKANQEIEYRNKELEHKTKELEVRKQELEIRNKELEAQTQQNQNLQKIINLYENCKYIPLCV